MTVHSHAFDNGCVEYNSTHAVLKAFDDMLGWLKVRQLDRRAQL
jgi:hypothetical protein